MKRFTSAASNGYRVKNSILPGNRMGPFGCKILQGQHEIA